MSLLDEITGGANENAAADLASVMQQIQALQTPTAQQLQLSPLANFTSAGELTPAQMEAAQAGESAFNNENLSAVPMSTMQQVLAKENEIASSNGMTPQEQAAIAQAEEAVNENTAGQRGAIAADFAGKGIPASLIAAALENGTVGQDAEQAYQNALQAQAGAANEGLTALSNEGSLAGVMNQQQDTQANTVAAAQNALNEFNAANTQAARTSNLANEQAANTYDVTNAQNIANENTNSEQQVQIQNQIEAPQEAAALALQKAGLEAGVGEAQSGQQTAVGEQNAGLFGGLLGAGATMGASALAPGVTVNAPVAHSGAIPAAEGGEIPPPPPTVPATNFLRGGPVPGHAPVPGNSPKNDIVPARLSPGEFVVPRTAMANPAIREFLAKNVPTPRPPQTHPSDIASVMRALTELRGAA
jgi:hypothetical protein